MRLIIHDIMQRGKITSGYISAFGLLLISFLLTMYANKQLIKKAELVENTNKIITNVGSMLSEVKDAETGYQGFLISKDIRFLMPYVGSRLSADSIYRETAALLTDNVGQLAHLSYIKSQIDLKYKSIQNTLIPMQSGGVAPMNLNSMVSDVNLMDKIRSEVFLMQKDEKKLLLERNAALRKNTLAVTVIIIVSIIVSFFLVVFALSAHVEENTQRVLAQQKIIAYQDELNTRIKELDQANTKLIDIKGQEKFAAAGRMALIIAHEIRNPLTNIDLAAEQLKADFQNDENGRFIFNVIERNSQRINHLVTELLSCTKFTDLQVEKISLTEMIEETLCEAKEMLLSKNVTLVRKFGKNSCDVVVDRAKMKVALMNIIINAIEAREDTRPAEFIVETKKNKNNTCTTVITDNGRGMDEEEVSTLFEPYFTCKPNGKGLALIRTQNIILNHKGNIAVTSKKEEGTSFTITLDTTC